MKLIENLSVTQNGVRNPGQIGRMMKYVSEGGFFTKETMTEFDGSHHLIAISRFPDTWEFIHDGHHRALACYLGGRDYLREDEYEVSDWTYPQYTNVNHELGFYTPFDPKTQLRLADFGPYRTDIWALVKSGAPVDEVENYVKLNAHRYRVKRGDIHNTHDISQTLLTN